MKKKILKIFLLAFVFRLSLIFVAYHGDLNNNISWATLAFDRGLKNFYEGASWPFSAPNQPPLTILTFAFARAVWLAIEKLSWFLNNTIRIFPSGFIWFWEERGMVLLLKLPGIVADMGIAWLIYTYFKKRKSKKALLLSAVWLFNPITLYNSSIWGQTDSVVNFLGLIGVYYLLKKDFLKFTFSMTLSLLFKGSLAIFVPILLVIALVQGYKLKLWIKAVLVSLGTLFVVSIWFHPQTDVFLWLFNLYKNRIFPGEIGYLTANAFNFWWLVNPGKVLDSSLYFGIAARIWGFVLLGAGIIAATFWLKKKKLSDKRIFTALVLLSLISFLFMTRIHERYLYPFFPVATILLGLVPGMLIPYIILSITHLLNLYHLFWAPPLAGLELIYRTAWFMPTLSVINILVFFWLLLIVLLPQTNQSG